MAFIQRSEGQNYDRIGLGYVWMYSAHDLLLRTQRYNLIYTVHVVQARTFLIHVVSLGLSGVELVG